MAPDQAPSPVQRQAQSTWRELLDRLRVRQLSAPRRILYVDRDEAHAASFRRVAQSLGATVDVATDLIEAFSHCVEFAYDVVAVTISDGLAEKLLEPVRALQSSAAIVLLRETEKLLNVVPPEDPGVAGILTIPFSDRHVDGLLRRAFALADTRLEWGSSVRTSLLVHVRVLFVGTEGEQRFVTHHLTTIQSGAPVDVCGVRSLAEATLVLDSQPVDAIVTSLTLPDARGLDAIARFSDGPKSKPVIALGDQRDEPLVIQVLRHGAHEFLTYSMIAGGRLEEALSSALDRHHATERVAHLAHHDALTGLANRSLFEQHLQASISRASRKREQLAVLYIDLNDFKPINDHHGHDAGDRVLCAVAKRLRASIRDYDTAARLGGDEFAVLLDSLERPEEAETVACRIRAAVDEPIDLGASAVSVGCSVGIAVYPAGGHNAETLLREADRAMYRVKHSVRPEEPRPRPGLRLVWDAHRRQ